MICEKGRVVSVEPEFVWVETIQTSTCSACSAKSACGQSLLNSIFSGKRHYVRVSTADFNEPVQIHDQVELAIPEDVMLTGSFWVYLLPLVCLMLGAVFGQQYAVDGSDGPAVAGAFVGFLLACVVLRIHAHYHRNNPRFHPVLHKVLSANTASVQTVAVEG